MLNLDGTIAFDYEPHQIAWLNENEKEMFWGYCNNMGGRGSQSNKILGILSNAAEKFQLLGIYSKVIECADKVLEYDNLLGIELRVKTNLALYSAYAAQGDLLRAEEYLRKAREAVEAESTERALTILLNAQISDRRSWNVGLNPKNADAAIKICDASISELSEIKTIYPFSALMSELELRKNKLYISRDLASRNSQALRDECLSVLEETVKIYKMDPDNHRNVDILGFASNLYRKYTSDLNAGEEEIDKVEKIINRGLDIREKEFNRYGRDIWSLRGYAWSIHDKALFLMEMRENYQQSMELLIKAKCLRLEYLNRFPNDNGVLADLVENYVDLYRAEKKPGGDSRMKSSKEVSGVLNRMNIGRRSARFRRLRKYIEESGLQYIT